MNFPTLSAHAEEFLALKRAVAKVDAVRIPGRLCFRCQPDRRQRTPNTDRSEWRRGRISRTFVQVRGSAKRRA